MTGFSPQTLGLFAELLSMVSLPASADDFEHQAHRIAQAKRELAAAVDEQTGIAAG